MQTQIDTIHVRLPSDVVEWLDFLVGKGVYKSRSEAIRSFMRNKIEK